MHDLFENVLDQFPCPVIDSHPASPGRDERVGAWGPDRGPRRKSI